MGRGEDVGLFPNGSGRFLLFACGCTYMWRLEVNMGVLNHSPPHCLKHGLSLTPVFTKWLDLTDRAPGMPICPIIPPPVFPAYGYNHVGAGCSNSGPHARAAGTALAGPSLPPHSTSDSFELLSEVPVLCLANSGAQLWSWRKQRQECGARVGQGHGEGVTP